MPSMLASDQSLMAALGSSVSSFSSFLTNDPTGRTLLSGIALLAPALMLARSLYVKYGTKYAGLLDKPLQAEYDYIIVGGGSAGCVLAARLSEDAAVQVLLLEAGGADEHVNISVPAAAAKLQLQPQFDWAYKSEAQKNSHLAMPGRISNWPRGRVLGGSSSINYMLWVRGVKEDFSDWVRDGCLGWAWEDVLPYFVRLENCAPEIGANEGELRGRSGPMRVSRLTKYGACTHAFVEACKQLGVPFTDDYNGAKNAGVSYAQYSTYQGARWSTATAYLKPAINRPNLTVLTRAQATRVIFSERKEAIGVAYRRGDSPAAMRGVPDVIARARKEVILCGGAINSPQLLMLSGIGPKAHLQSKDIRVLVDSPGVGQHLQDHPCVPMVYPSKIHTLSGSDENLTELSKFFTKGEGALTSCGVEAFLFMNSGCRTDLESRPDMQFHYFAATFDRTMLNMFNFQQAAIERYLSIFKDSCTHSLLATLVRPRSQGSITLANADPMSYPIIEPNYFDHPDDVAMLVASCMRAEEVMAQAAMRSVTDLPAPGSNGRFAVDVTEGNPHDFKKQPKKWWEHYCRSMAITLYHPCATVKMGADNDPMSPLDREFRVKGVSRLRVVDASAMPHVPSGNTNCSTIMLAERASDFIRGKASINSSPSLRKGPAAGTRSSAA